MSVLLKKSDFDGVSSKELAQQIESKKKSEKKLPTWFHTPKIYYPKKLNIEQTSSEITAGYKASLVNGQSLLDLTGGFGVDSYFFAQRVTQVVHCETNKELSEIAAYNFKILGVSNITCLITDGIEFLHNTRYNFEWIYIDPSRRNETKGKVFVLSDCLPDVPKHLDLLFSRTDNILIKTAPLLDFSVGIKELDYVKEIHVVAVSNEVKELLWILGKGVEEEIVIKTINVRKDRNEIFNFKRNDEKRAIAAFSAPLNYLYEPNAAILKAGAFKLIGHRLVVKKLQEHTHLYTSSELIDFPGRVFRIEKTFPYSRKLLQQERIQKANITTRNFPESVEAIRKKFNIKEGGDAYLFFVKDLNNNLLVLRCSKL